jgi:H+/Cl- antiporter ClcA
VAGLCYIGGMKKYIVSMAQWLGLGILVGLLSGCASALFLTWLYQATSFRLEHPWLVLGLPLAGLVLGAVYQVCGKEVLPGNNLVLDRLHSGGPQLPWRMAPLVLLGTVWTHLFGGSAGREGTGVQMGASLADGAAHAMNLNPTLRRHMLAAGVAGGFASVFGTPLAGAIFGLEVVVVGGLDYEALMPALVAALVGDWCTRAWGVQHTSFPILEPVSLDGLLALKWIIFGALVAAVAWLFIELTHGIKGWSQKAISALPLRLAVGGLLVALLSLLPNMGDYLGLSTPLISQALGSTPPVPWAFALKLLFTAITLGFGFIGGEVTPLFVIGACLGSASAAALGLPGPLAAGVGLAAMFGAAANTPMAMIVMAVELLGPGVLPHVALVVVVAYLLTGKRSIYTGQKWGKLKHGPDPMAVALVELAPAPKPAKKTARRR